MKLKLLTLLVVPFFSFGMIGCNDDDAAEDAAEEAAEATEDAADATAEAAEETAEKVEDAAQ